MYLIKVIPATKIPLSNPQILTYFTARELSAGSLVLVPLYKRKVIAVVESIEKIDGQKMALRKAEFELRGIAKTINSEQIISEKQISLAKWISEYYWCPIGAVIKLMIPASLSSLRGVRPSGGRRSNPAESQNNSTDTTFSQKNKQQTLILTPEISFIEDIAKQYKITDYITLHSDLTDKQYYENWSKIKSGKPKNIIATRMALFAPFQNLKEIIIENEHSDLHKSRQTPRYHAREVALKLAELWQAKIALKSPTPSIETSWLAENQPIGETGKKIYLHHPKSNIQNLTSKIIDLREELKTGNFSIFSRSLQEKIKSTLQKKDQIVLFINRRGASTVLMCRDCGYTPKCPNCDVPLVYHLSPVQFLCHRCGHYEFPPVVCPNCLGTRIKFFGAGTQKVEMEFKKLFPEAKIARLDSDIVSSVIPAPSSVIPAPCPSEAPQQGEEGKAGIQVEKIINDFRTKKIQVLIGTQIILNKNLPKAPLVAMMVADTILHLPDFRSNEKTFQIISQLKALSQKEFLLQTYSPENPAIQFAIKNDYQSFYQEEIVARKELSYPPFSQLIKLIYQHKSAKKSADESKILAEKLKQQIAINIKQLTGVGRKTNIVNLQPFVILGPSPAFISKVGGKYIWQIILKFTLPPIRASLASGGSQVEGAKLTDLKLRNKILQIVPLDWIINVDPLQII